VLDSRRDLERKTELFKRELLAKSDLDTAQAALTTPRWPCWTPRAPRRTPSTRASSPRVAQLRVVDAQLLSARAQVDQKKAGLVQARPTSSTRPSAPPVNGCGRLAPVDVGPDGGGLAAGAGAVH
jgi:hypothetical protein